MLKDNIKRREEILKQIRKNNEGDYFKHEMKGEVEIKAWKNNQLFYHDGGNNTVTVWAKHALVRLLSGDSFSSIGTTGSGALGNPYLYTQPSPAAGEHTSALDPPILNIDGTMLSGEQFFWDYDTYTKYYLNRTSVGTDPTVAEPANTTPPTAQRPGDTPPARIYPFFPTKMLFGTGYEFESWADVITAGFDDYLGASGQGYDETTFNSNISENTTLSQQNNYSNTFDEPNTTVIRTRTVNDKIATLLTTDEGLYEDDYGIDGAIKNCLAKTKVSNTEINNSASANILTDGRISPSFNGIGRPAFIYCKRSDHWFTNDTAEIIVRADNTISDNRIVFTVVLPEQSGATAGYFNPYNGFPSDVDTDGMILKQAGLFCDARLTLLDETPAPGDPPAKPYFFMPGGIMIAKRKISPITKTPDVRISVSWSLYL